MRYDEFLLRKTQYDGEDAITDPVIPVALFDYQAALVEWALRKGRAAILADCGLGKTPMQFTWADNVVRRTNKPVLIATPLAVSLQAIHEAEKFGFDAKRSSDGTPHKGITITNYERLHHFNPDDFAGMVCDESSILKNFDGALKGVITAFMRKMPYRLLCTATAAPNDYIELGTSSEALGYLGYMDMLGRFFKNDQNSIKATRSRRFETGPERFGANKWRFKGHAEQPFWRWVSSWARAMRRPSDLGFDDGPLILPALIEREHDVKSKAARDGCLFNLPAVGLKEQREERRLTIQERCEKVAELTAHDDYSLIWCHMNAEGDLLESLCDGAVQVSGKDSDESKEQKLTAFVSGEIKKLVTKPKIGAWGLNFQHCAHVTYFPSHSFEQYYQAVRRCWRFGQKRPVNVDIIATEGDQGIVENLQRKQAQADRMFDELVRHMTESMHIDRRQEYPTEMRVPKWL